MKMIILN